MWQLEQPSLKSSVMDVRGQMISRSPSLHVDVSYEQLRQLAVKVPQDPVSDDLERTQFFFSPTTTPQFCHRSLFRAKQPQLLFMVRVETSGVKQCEQKLNIP